MDYFSTINDYCLPGEVWSDIPGYEGLYEASIFGRVRSVDGKVTFSKRHGKRVWRGRVLKPRGKTTSGYRVSLWKNKKSKDFLVARLVGFTFLGIPEDEDMTINHKDGDRFNNHVDNLEWLSLKDNIRHAFETGLMSTCKPVKLITSNKVKEFRSLAEASRFLGRSNGYVSCCLINNKMATDKNGNAVKIIS